MNYFIINGDLVTEDMALVSVQDRGFRYGDGVFETIAVHAGVPYQFSWHMQRLAGGLNALKIAYDTSKIKEFTVQLLQKNAVSNGILRIQITRGIGSKGYLPDPSHKLAGATLVMETLPIPALHHRLIALWCSDYRKTSASALPVQYKTSQGLNSILARIDAVENKCADALMLNEHGQVCETSSGNIFWMKDGTLYTPSLDCGVLMGSTRAAILRLSPYPAMEIKATLDTLLQADAVFMTNVTWPVMHVGALLPQNKQWDSEKLAEEFRQLIMADRAAYSQRNEW